MNDYSEIYLQSSETLSGLPYHIRAQYALEQVRGVVNLLDLDGTIVRKGSRVLEYLRELERQWS